MADRIVVIGGGFAGLWSAASAARARSAFAIPESELEIVLVAPEPYHTIRVRCYEADLDPIRVPLEEVLAPINVRRMQGRVTRIDPASRTLAMEETPGDHQSLGYDRLVVASGSSLARPAVPIACETFDVDTYEGGQRLAAHLATLAERPSDDATRCAVVVGGGLVGIEIACELPGRLRAVLGAAAPLRVVLVDVCDVGATMGEGHGVVREALDRLAIEVRSHAAIAAVDVSGVTLTNGEHIPAATVIFATGLQASPLTRDLGVTRDRLGRVPVDRFLKVTAVDAVYAAGDCASAAADDQGHVTVMSCQHARPMGRVAGHNAVCDLTRRLDDRVPFAAPDYVTILDLGPAGALYTAGWERGRMVAKGSEAKTTKQIINATRIYPPRHASRDTIFAAAEPVIQARPAAGSASA